MRALSVIHEPTCHLGTIRDRLDERGVSITEHLVTSDSARPESHSPFPDPFDFDFMLVMGASYSLNDHASIRTWIDRELEMLGNAAIGEVPMLAVCFGAQALAAALGGEVTPATPPEIGWYEVTSMRPELIAPGPWFQWHTDRFSVPPGATELACTSHHPQAFVYRRALAVQFHPEITPGQMETWLRLSGTEEWDEVGADVEEVLAESRARRHASAAACAVLVDRFIDTFVRADRPR
ncbi:MAG: hypothetical protein JJLCMIEE_00933 [Acidimicrobiales bacterium]|nr:MAG: aminotransferase [Actinomycetota bacterium]MBV6507875.1 hypothetical protein [Acidimicrobiales bacterium]RIK06020.1 MAG: aminotransferase [Acidobacteriota bacterium]